MSLEKNGRDVGSPTPEISGGVDTPADIQKQEMSDLDANTTIGEGTLASPGTAESPNGDLRGAANLAEGESPQNRAEAEAKTSGAVNPAAPVRETGSGTTEISPAPAEQREENPPDPSHLVNTEMGTSPENNAHGQSEPNRIQKTLELPGKFQAFSEGMKEKAGEFVSDQVRDKFGDKAGEMYDKGRNIVNSLGSVKDIVRSVKNVNLPAMINSYGELYGNIQEVNPEPNGAQRDNSPQNRFEGKLDDMLKNLHTNLNKADDIAAQEGRIRPQLTRLAEAEAMQKGEQITPGEKLRMDIASLITSGFDQNDRNAALCDIGWQLNDIFNT